MKFGKWILREEENLVSAQVLIPRQEIHAFGFERDLRWLMCNRYNVDNFDKTYKQIVKRLGPDSEDGRPLLIDEDEIGNEAPTGRSLHIVYHEETIILHIHGRLPLPGKNGKLKQITFNYKAVPGKKNPDGSMNWYELDKFAVVEKGDSLCILLEPIDGKDGISIYNSPIKPPLVEPYELKIGSGVKVKKFEDKISGRTGMRLTSGIKGVVSCKKDRMEALRSIDVEDVIKTKCISFKTGNLGDQEVKIPVPIFLEEFRPDFKLYSTAFVKCDEVYGGFLTTEDEARLGIVNAGSHIVAGKRITADFVQNSTLEAPEVVIINNIIDVRVKTDRFVARSTGRSVVINTEIDAGIALLKGVLLQGSDNVIDLGKSLVEEEKELYDSVKDANIQIAQFEDDITSLLESVKIDLAIVVKMIDPKKKKPMIEFFRNMHTYSQPALQKALDSFKEVNNLKKIEALKKKLIRISEAKSIITGHTEKRDAALDRLGEIKKELSDVSFSIKGVVANGASLKIRHGDWEKVYTPNDKENLSLNVSGKLGYNGLMNLYKKNVQTGKKYLSYQEVTTKDAQNQRL